MDINKQRVVLPHGPNTVAIPAYNIGFNIGPDGQCVPGDPVGFAVGSDGMAKPVNIGFVVMPR